MASINGDWFHSRSSCNLTELLAVRKLVIESQKLEYIGFNWSGGRENNPKMFKFASLCGVRPSTMQTKIRTMIRFGFIRDTKICPLQWTRMGSLWNDLYTIGNYKAAKNIFEIILITSLAIYTFNDSRYGYSINPSKGELPIKTLFNLLDEKNSISADEFEILVDGNTERVGMNAPYWLNDLLNAGLFVRDNKIIKYTGKYPSFIKEIKNFAPNPLFTDEDWIKIRENPLIEISPFKKELKAIFLKMASLQNIVEQINDEILTEPLIDIVSEEEERLAPEIDVLSEGTKIIQTNQRVRNATWALRIKNKYLFKCAVPVCDVDGRIFVEAAHIKPDKMLESGTPHRAHILNGLCLCRHCHVLFDKGYFSLTDDSRIMISKELNSIITQNIKKVLLSSDDKYLKNRIDNRLPLVEFIQYHRKNKFRC